MQWMCSEATAAGEGSMRMMLQNSSSVPAMRILQKHSQSTVLPDCELPVLSPGILRKEHHDALLYNLVHCKNRNSRIRGLQKKLKLGFRLLQEI